jgi:hypothetical protein
MYVHISTSSKFSGQGEVLLIAGGASKDANNQPVLDPSVSTFDGQAWSSGSVAAMPDLVMGNCIARLDSHRLLSIGGTKNGLSPTTKTNFFDAHKNVWTVGPELNKARYLF